MRNIKIKKPLFFAVFLLIVILVVNFILAVPNFLTSGSTNYTNEDSSPSFWINFTNLTNNSLNEILVFDILEISSSNSLHSGFTLSNYTWITWNDTSAKTNSSKGIMNINATRDNETGRFNVTIFVGNYPERVGESRPFYFEVNATNDPPNFTNINTTYNITSLEPLFLHLNATDEEGHYPLNFTVAFNSTSCVHASWSGMNNNQNCSLFGFGFNFSHTNNLSALMNFTPTANHVGTYYANISVVDFGARYNSSASPYQTSDYSLNKTTYYSSTVTFNIFSSLSLNTGNCDNKIFQENQYGSCNVTVRTKGAADSLNISSYAILRHYASGQSSVSNTSWFYLNHTNISSNFEYNVTINVSPSKTEIGNWTINFTVTDTTYSETSTSQIYVYVNRTSNDVPDLDSISNVNTSINLLTVINLAVYDDDLLVPDKNSSFGGFNETTTFNRTILNQSNLSQQLSLSNFSIGILQMPVSGTNRTTAEIRFTSNSSDVGSYTVNITANDSQGSRDFGIFNLSIINNSAPDWNSTLTTNFSLTEDTLFYLNLSQNVSDSDGNTLTFSYANDTSFDNFNLTSAGIINFTPRDADVGQHIVNITVSDGYLTDTAQFSINVSNVNDSVSIIRISTANASTNETFNYILGASLVNLTEDNYTTFTLLIEDDDFKIPSGQKSYYNESLTVNLAIQGPNTTLFNFTYDSMITSNRSVYVSSFTPRKASVGNYNVTVNASDRNGTFSSLSFTMTVLNVSHNPVMSSLSNQSSAVNRSFYYDVNVTDTENGNDTSGTNTNFTFSYTNLSGNNIFSSYFNTTTGVFNITFNSSHAGSYGLSVTVTDSGGSTDTETFWIFVYNSPNVTSPASGYVFNQTENTTSILNFTVNHTVLDNLTYLFYVDGITCAYQSNLNCNYTSSLLRNTVNYYGNGTSYNWSFTPNFTDETYGLLKNLTLVVYPNSSSLVNASQINTTVVYKLNISHTNSPLTFSGDISDKGPVTHDNDITFSLTDYFSDADYSDSYYAQSVTWTLNSNTSLITSSVSSSWALTLSASTAVIGSVNITGNDGSTNATSNQFIVIFTEPSVSSSSSSSSSSGGGASEIPVSLKILLPDPISAFQKDKIVLPITLHNTGSVVLNRVSLFASVAYNGSIAEDINLTFDNSYFNAIGIGEKKNTTLTANIDTNRLGLYEITVNASVDIPDYNDWGKIYLTIKEGENIEEKILFTEEFIVSNPECIELKELVDEAREFLSFGNTEAAIKKTDEALDACKSAIAQAGKSKIKEIIENKFYRYLAISAIVVLCVGVSYYSYKRIKLKRMRGVFAQQDIKNRKYLERQYGR